MSSNQLSPAEMMTPTEMMVDACRLRFADQQRIKAAQQRIKALEQENNALEQQNKDLKQENKALEQEIKDLKQRVGTLEISQEGQSVVASGGQVSEEPVTPSSVEGIPEHQLIWDRKRPYRGDDHVAINKDHPSIEALHVAIRIGTAFGNWDSCAICKGGLEYSTDYNVCDCDETECRGLCSCGVILSEDRDEAVKQFQQHLDIIKNEKQ